MAAQHDEVDESDVVAKAAVVSHMRTAQQKTLLTDYGSGIGIGSPVNRDILADDRPASDSTVAALSLVRHVLRLVTDNDAGMQNAFLADFGPTGDVDVVVQTAARRDADVAVDHAI